jgi:hypothetical protein
MERELCHLMLGIEAVRARAALASGWPETDHSEISGGRLA